MDAFSDAFSGRIYAANSAPRFFRKAHLPHSLYPRVSLTGSACYTGVATRGITSTSSSSSGVMCLSSADEATDNGLTLTSFRSDRPGDGSLVLGGRRGHSLLLGGRGGGRGGGNNLVGGSPELEVVQYAGFLLRDGFRSRGCSTRKDRDLLLDRHRIQRGGITTTYDLNTRV